MQQASQRWPNAPTLYLARTLQEMSDDVRSVSVLDVGCGDGTTMAQLGAAGFDVYGYELRAQDAKYQDSRRPRLAWLLGSDYDAHVKVTDSEENSPSMIEMFDVAYANQVFEHVRFLDPMLAECARVLKPGGTLLVLLPLASSPLEPHLLVPGAHWLPPGRLRIKYLTLASRLGMLRPREPSAHATASENARAWDAYLRDHTYFRFINEITHVALHYFEQVDVDTRQLVTAKIDLLSASPSRRDALLAGIMRRLDVDGGFSVAVTVLLNAALRITRPRASRSP